MKRLLPILCLLFSGVAMAQTDIEQPNLGVPSKIAPAYFGPNAFPVPDMLDFILSLIPPQIIIN